MFLLSVKLDANRKKHDILRTFSIFTNKTILA